MALEDINVATGLADVSLGRESGLVSREFEDVDSLIQSRTKPAINILRGGTEEALRLSRLAQQEATAPLERFADLSAFEEQQALLGTLGDEKQEAAIGGIPLSEFDKELIARQQKQFVRQASARGERGSGSTILGGQRLAGQQQSKIIERRLAELEPLVAASRGVSSTLSSLDEAARARQAQIQSALGSQIASIRFGTTAPLIQSELQRGELSGLRTLGQANVRGQRTAQLANVAGQFAPQIAGLFSSPPPQTVPTATLQTGTTTNFIPQAGTVAVA